MFVSCLIDTYSYNKFSSCIIFIITMSHISIRIRVGVIVIIAVYVCLSLLNPTGCSRRLSTMRWVLLEVSA